MSLLRFLLSMVLVLVVQLPLLLPPLMGLPPLPFPPLLLLLFSAAICTSTSGLPSGTIRLVSDDARRSRAMPPLAVKADVGICMNFPEAGGAILAVLVDFSSDVTIGAVT